MKLPLLLLSLTFSALASELPTPLAGLEAINAGKLKYLGRDLFPGNDQNRTCVYKSDRAYVLYNNCLSSKKESAATDIEVIFFDGGIVSYYIQNKENLAPVSTQVRAQYDMTWRVGVTPTGPVGHMTIAQLKAFKEDTYNAMGGGCFIGKTFQAQDLSSTAQCFGACHDRHWAEAAEIFWREPGQEFYDTLKGLRRVVVETKF